ncbi:unnamed protein product [Durusdinium trenchii]|uniref:Ion transport domain-containing protein n=1 Tax=Durusdinium trenchii TaxID=1381693 RepID=A0ABP0NQY4_9DINO
MELLATLLYLFLLTFPKKLLAIASLNLWRCPEFCEGLTRDAALCLEQGSRWVPTISQNFDNIWYGMLTLFEISTTEGWVDVMYSAADSTQPYVQPKRDNNETLWVPFFMLYMFFSNMFIVNLSVGVIVDKFMEMKPTSNNVTRPF